MMPMIGGTMLAVANSLAGSIVAKVTVSTALGLLAAWLGRGNRAAIRHVLLVATFGVIYLLPVGTALMPPLRIGVPVGMEGRATWLPFGIGIGANASATTAGAGRIAAVAPHAPKLRLSDLLLAGWGAGVALFLLPMVAGLWQIRSLRRSGLPWRRGQSVAEPLALDAGIQRRVEVLLHEALPGPMTCGVVRPAIVLPRDAENWNPEDLNRAIVHELEHVRRGDSLTRCLARAACAVYWFHPLVWIAWRKLLVESERSCDDAVLRRSEATAYADQLVGLAKRLSAARRSPLVAMANRADLATRIRAVLDCRQTRGRAGAFSVALVCGWAAALVIPMSPLTLIGAPQSNPADAQKFEVASIKPAEEPTAGRPVLWGIRSDPQQVTYSHQTLLGLISNAYAVDPERISGGPDWIRSDPYDIVAKVPPGTPKTRIPLLLKALLADRFGLIIRHETKEAPVYAMVPGKGGPKLKTSPEISGLDDSGAPKELSSAPIKIFARGAKLGICCGRAELHRVTMAMFAELLAAQTDRPVIDRTGISGTFEISLHWAPEDSPETSSEPSIYTALQEQLGIKLEPLRAPLDFLTIDRIEKPSEN